jgi:tRNA pseudouridine38-40 synthase
MARNSPSARYRFAVEYQGTAYAGWQVQDGQPTVQEALEKALRTCLRTPVTVTGAGRTDAGVHARGQVAHFDVEEAIDPRRVEHSVNALTPPDVVVRRMEACEPGFHARYDAVTRLYRYRIARRPVALLAHMAWYPGFRIDESLLREELGHVVGLRDFVNFSVPRDDGKSTDCEVVRAEVEDDGAFVTVVLEANRFLHKMVRSMVGASFDVARGARPPGLVRGILDGSYRGEWTWAPALGLCLEKVTYKDYDPG